MSFWANEVWIEASKSHEYVSGFIEERLSDGAYKLSLGGEAIVSSGHAEQESSSAYRSLGAGAELKLLPGQFAYLITEEVVHLTTDIIGFINVETKVKLKGLVNISGFHVDAGYKGKLVFTVFNAGPTPIIMFRGDTIFRFWISDFRGSGSKPKMGFQSIPRDWADRLHGTYPSPFALAARLSELEKQITDLKSQKNQFLIYAFIISIFLFPFVAGLYASVFAPWFGNAVSEKVMDSVFKRNPTSTSPLSKEPTEPKHPPSANGLPDGEKLDAAKPRP